MMNEYDYKQQPDLEYVYYIYDPNDGTMFYFKCIKERHRYARSAIRYYLNDDGWNEEVRQLVTGTVTHMVTRYNTTERPDEEELDEEGCDGEGTYWGDFSYRCDFKLQPVESLRVEMLDKPSEESTNESETT